MIGDRIIRRRPYLIANHPVGMAFLLGNWATERWATRIAGRLNDHRLISFMFDISLPTGRSATAVAQRQVGMVVNHLVGMGL